MQARYLDVAEKHNFTISSCLGISLRVLQLIQCGLIITYCILWRSIESTLALMVLLSCIALALNKRYIYDKKQEVLMGNLTQGYLQPVQTRRFLWMGFLIINVAFTIFKIIYFTTKVMSMTQDLEKALEVESPLMAFLPCVFLLTTPPLILIKHSREALEDFKQPIHKLVVILTHTLLIMLLIVLQFLNVSLMGLILVMVVALLNSGGSWNFNRKRYLIYFTVFFMALWMLTIYISSLPVVNLNDQMGRILGFEYLEIEGQSVAETVAFSVCTLLTYFLANYMNRLYSYEEVRKKFSDDREQYLLKRMEESVGDSAELSEEEEEEPSSEQASNENELTNRCEPSKSLMEPISFKEERNISLGLRKQLTNMEYQEEEAPEPLRKSIYLGQNTNINEVKIEAKPPTWQEKFLSFLNSIKRSLTSVHFNYRLLQLFTIVLIQRYNTVYSILLILWLLLSSIFNKLSFLRISTIVLVIPATMFNYFPMYYSNIPEIFYPPTCGKFPCSVYGFIHWPDGDIWIDVIIFNFYIYLLLTFIKITAGELILEMKRKKKEEKKKKSKIPQLCSIWRLLVAFFFRYTYLITLIIMFIVGFSSVNLIHLGFSLLFLVFFALGQQLLVEVTMKDGKQIKVVGTFSQKHWILIVHYTGIIILLKYIYFLLFSDYNSGWLQLTGINKTYPTQINFSLTDYCQSNTTYLFVIFILAALQLEVCRSDTYKEYSINMMYHISERPSVRKRWHKIEKVWEFVNCVYYQSIYAVSAIVVLTCNYKWSINGIIVASCVVYGVIYGFGKGRVWLLAMWSNLIFIAVNYLLMFLSYQYVIDLIGQNVQESIELWAVRLGFFSVRLDTLQTLFLLNIVIYFFSVHCLQLYRVLQAKNLQLTVSTKEEEHKERSSNVQSSHVSSVSFNRGMDRNNEKFAEAYLKNVVYLTCQYYEKDLSDYTFFRVIKEIMAFIMAEVALLFVIICCLYFRIAVTMFIFLTIYLMHYMLQFKQITGVLKRNKYLEELEKHMSKFREKGDLLYSGQAEPAYRQDQTFEEYEQLISITQLTVKSLKLAYRKRMWPFVAFFTFLCLILTYSLQIVTLDFCSDSCTYTSFLVQKSLVIAGLSTSPDINLWSEVYFYFFMAYICMWERELLNYTEKGVNKEKEEIQKVQKMPDNLQHIKQEEEEDADDGLRKPTAEEKELFELQVFQNHQSTYNKALHRGSIKQKLVFREADQAEIYKQSNLAFFYQFSSGFMKIQAIFGFMTVLLRVYITLLLINCSQKANIFSWVYLIIAAVFWVKTIKYEMVEDINRISIVILLVQYLFLLLNINSSSAGYVDLYAPYSLVGQWITDQQWLSYLAFGGTSSSLRVSNEQVSFIINSIIVFATEYYFTVFYLATLYTLRTFKRLKVAYQYIEQEIRRASELQTKLYLNYQTYKSVSYRFLRKLYETGTLHYHLILSLVILLIVLGFQTALSIGLMVLAALYFCLVIFSSKKEQNLKNIQKYTYWYFYICKIIAFLQLFMLAAFDIPTLISLCDGNGNNILKKVCYQVEIMSVTGQLFLLLFVQLWFDMYEGQEYHRLQNTYRKSNRFVHRLMNRCTVYWMNEQKLKAMFAEHQETVDFQKQVDDAMRAIEEWHKIMRKEYGMTEDIEVEKFTELKQTIKMDYKTQVEQAMEKDAGITTWIYQKLKRTINHSLYQSVPSLVMDLRLYNARVLNRIDVSWHDFVTQNFKDIEKRLDELEQYYDELHVKIEKCPAGECQSLLKKEAEKLPKPDDSQGIQMPSILEIREQKPILTLPEIFMYLLASRFQDVVLFLILMYYVVNPCLASLPIVLMILSYEIVAEIKRKNWLLVYIVLLIAAIQTLQEEVFLNSSKIPKVYGWFIYYQDPKDAFSTSYLEFLLVMVLLNELLKMWLGMADKQPVQIQNLYQALVRCELNTVIEEQSPVMQQPEAEEEKELSVVQSIQQTHLEMNKNIKSAIVNTEVIDEKDRNPYEVCLEQLELKPALILDDDSNCSFFKKLWLLRDGTDLYPFIASVQIISIIYLIIFFPIMENTDLSSGPTSLNSNKFSTPLIMTVLLYVVLAVIERWIATLAYHRGRKELTKFIYTMFILLLVTLGAWWLAPYNGKGIEISYIPRPALIGFTVIQFLYLILSDLQVKWGYRKYKRYNSMLHKRNYVNDIVTSVFVAIPFLYELKLIMDWSFCQTGLTLENWIRHFNIYLTSFQSTINSMTARAYRLGHPIPMISKIVFGWCGFILILVLIFGPMILFSGLNPVSEPNLVIGGQLQIGIQIQNSNYFPLYSTSHFSNPPQIVSPSLFDQMGFSQIPLLASLSPQDIQQQFQVINYEPFSDNNWDISTPNYQLLLSKINETLTQMQLNQTVSNQFNMVIQYELNRNISESVSSPTEFNYPFLQNGTVVSDSKLALNQQQLQSMYNTLTICSSSTQFSDFYLELIRLESQGNTFKPKPIIKNGSNGLPMYLQNVSVTLMCNKAITNLVAEAGSTYWQVSTNNSTSNPQGIVMYVLCDKYTALSFGFTFIGLYTSIILVIAGFIRGFFTGNISMIPYTQNPRPQSILCICEAIEILRMRNNLRKEVLLYYQLIDIIRSPEIIKYMCGNYTRFIKDEELKKEEEERIKNIKVD